MTDPGWKDRFLAEIEPVNERVRKRPENTPCEKKCVARIRKFIKRLPEDMPLRRLAPDVEGGMTLYFQSTAARVGMFFHNDAHKNPDDGLAVGIVPSEPIEVWTIRNWKEVDGAIERIRKFLTTHR